MIVAFSEVCSFFFTSRVRCGWNNPRKSPKEIPKAHSQHESVFNPTQISPGENEILKLLIRKKWVGSGWRNVSFYLIICVDVLFVFRFVLFYFSSLTLILGRSMRRHRVGGFIARKGRPFCLTIMTVAGAVMMMNGTCIQAERHNLLDGLRQLPVNVLHLFVLHVATGSRSWIRKKGARLGLLHAVIGSRLLQQMVVKAAGVFIGSRVTDVPWRRRGMDCLLVMLRLRIFITEVMAVVSMLFWIQGGWIEMIAPPAKMVRYTALIIMSVNGNSKLWHSVLL